jgi:hypothetical protein
MNGCGLGSGFLRDLPGRRSGGAGRVFFDADVVIVLLRRQDGGEGHGDEAELKRHFHAAAE